MWYSSNGTMRKVINHILISKCWQTCINYCTACRGAQLGNTDHWLLITNITIKIKVDHATRPETHLDMSHLQDPQFKKHTAAALQIGSTPYQRRMLVTGNTSRMPFQHRQVSTRRPTQNNQTSMDIQWDDPNYQLALQNTIVRQVWGVQMTQLHLQWEYQRRQPKILGQRGKETWRCGSVQWLQRVFWMLWQAKATPRSKN